MRPTRAPGAVCAHTFVKALNRHEPQPRSVTPRRAVGTVFVYCAARGRPCAAAPLGSDEAVLALGPVKHSERGG